MVFTMKWRTEHSRVDYRRINYGERESAASIYDKVSLHVSIHGSSGGWLLPPARGTLFQGSIVFYCSYDPSYVLRT
jgi:hypothetical protein